MNAIIKLDTREYIDLMNPPTLDNASDVVLSQDRERDDFKRTVEDVRLRVSDQEHIMSTKFRSYPITSNWEVIISDEGRQLFRGRAVRPIRSDVKDDWLDIQAYSKNKEFWEAAKVNRIAGYPAFQERFNTVAYPYDTTQVTVALLLPYALMNMPAGLFNGNNSPGVASGYSIDPLYTNRPIRWAYGSTYIDGRYEDLDRSTTVFELLTGLARYYNAEFFIDPETDKLTMLRRNAIQNDTEYNLDELILNDEEIFYDDSDGPKYEVLRAYFSLQKPSPVISDVVAVADSTSGIRGNNFLNYYWTYVISVNGKEVESEGSDPSTLYGFSSGDFYRFDMTVPVGPEGTIRRNIYKYGGETGVYRKTGEIADNTTTTFSDKIPVSEILSNKKIKFTPTEGNIFYRYDESTGSWSNSISYTDELPPGKVFDILPPFRFLNSDGTPKTLTLSSAYSFFGREIGLQEFAQQWKDLFVTKGKVFCSVKGLAFRLGDSFITSAHPKIPAGKYVVKKAYGRLMRERTKLELIKV